MHRLKPSATIMSFTGRNCSKLTVRTQSGADSTDAKLDIRIDAFHRLTAGSPPARPLERMKLYALFCMEELDWSSELLGPSNASAKRSKERNLSRPFAGENSLNGRIWKIPSAFSTEKWHSTSRKCIMGYHYVLNSLSASIKSSSARELVSTMSAFTCSRTGEKCQIQKGEYRFQ